MANLAMQSWQPTAASRLTSWVWWLAVLLVLHGAVPIAHHLPLGNERPLYGSLVLDSGPTLRPFGLSARSPTVQAEARSHAAPPDRYSEKDPPKAALLLSLLPKECSTTRPQPSAYGQPARPNAWRLFEARAPPMIA